MSFGFSVGDFLAVAELAYQLKKALSDSTGAAKEYQDLISLLNVVHKVLLHVDQLRAANRLAQATVNALLFTVNTTNVAMETFLKQHAAYSMSLRPGGSGNQVNDMFRKGRWAVRMRNRVSDLQRSIDTMLSAINCLVSLACYYNTAYDARDSPRLYPNIWPPRVVHLGHFPWQDIKPTARLRCRLNYSFRPELYPEFHIQSDPKSRFRRGQIFAAPITSDIELKHDHTPEINVESRSMKPITALEVAAENEQLQGPIEDKLLKKGLADKWLKGKRKRLAQIHQLPLKKMTRYCKEVSGNRKEVDCLRCSRPEWPSIYMKDEWASEHFRGYHWDTYISMLPEAVVTNILSEGKRPAIIPWERQMEDAPQPPDPGFSAMKWITLDDMTLSTPIEEDQQLLSSINSSSIGDGDRYARDGPNLIQRFVVVREGRDQCLALGIHTYARHGCGLQPDQELFGVLCPAKEAPPLRPDETKVILSPVRMKPDHPSLALPSTSRIHYGRSYEIDHDLPVQPLGLVHPASMETLLDQFQNSVIKFTPEEKERLKQKREYQDLQATTVEGGWVMFEE